MKLWKSLLFAFAVFLTVTQVSSAQRNQQSQNQPVPKSPVDQLQVKEQLRQEKLRQHGYLPPKNTDQQPGNSQQNQMGSSSDGYYDISNNNGASARSYRGYLYRRP